MENEIDPKIEQQVEQKLADKNRYEKLSEKVIVTSKERDEASAKAKSEAERADSIAKERDFYKEFSANASKYPSASEYQDKIFEKVKSGYTTEDATVSVLAKEGKLSTPQQTQRPLGDVAGGSAPNNMGGEAKSHSDMTLAEKLAALKEADASGDLARALTGR